jgi:hypothetical protein
MISQSNIKGIGLEGGEFDRLQPSRNIKIRQAQPGELATLSQIARDTIPGAHVSDVRLRSLCRSEPDTVFAFVRGTSLVGGAAFLYLNCHGADALLLDELDVHDPDPHFIAAPGESPEAIYLWAISGAGRSALGHVALRFAGPRYRGTDIFTRPVTASGIRLFNELGFEPMVSWRPGLWVYRRLANQINPTLPLTKAA